MARESSLSIKDKWALEAQLGEMLRGLDTSASESQNAKFEQRLTSLVEEYGMSKRDVVEILLSMQDPNLLQVAKPQA